MLTKDVGAALGVQASLSPRSKLTELSSDFRDPGAFGVLVPVGNVAPRSAGSSQPQVHEASKARDDFEDRTLLPEDHATIAKSQEERAISPPVLMPGRNSARWRPSLAPELDPRRLHVAVHQQAASEAPSVDLAETASPRMQAKPRSQRQGIGLVLPAHQTAPLPIAIPQAQALACRAVDDREVPQASPVAIDEEVGSESADVSLIKAAENERGRSYAGCLASNAAFARGVPQPAQPDHRTQADAAASTGQLRKFLAPGTSDATASVMQDNSVQYAAAPFLPLTGLLAAAPGLVEMAWIGGKLPPAEDGMRYGGQVCLPETSPDYGAHFPVSSDAVLQEPQVLTDHRPDPPGPSSQYDNAPIPSATVGKEPSIEPVAPRERTLNALASGRNALPAAAVPLHDRPVGAVEDPTQNGRSISGTITMRQGVPSDASQPSQGGVDTAHTAERRRVPVAQMGNTSQAEQPSEIDSAGQASLNIADQRPGPDQADRDLALQPATAGRFGKRGAQSAPPSHAAADTQAAAHHVSGFGVGTGEQVDGSLDLKGDDAPPSSAALTFSESSTPTSSAHVREQQSSNILAAAASGPVQASSKVAFVTGSDGSRQVVIAMQPAELGNIKVQIGRTIDGMTHVVVEAERPQTLHDLVRDRARLGSVLEQAGIPVDRHTVEFRTTDASAGPAGWSGVAGQEKDGPPLFNGFSHQNRSPTQNEAKPQQHARDITSAARPEEQTGQHEATLAPGLRGLNITA